MYSQKANQSKVGQEAHSSNQTMDTSSTTKVVAGSTSTILQRARLNPRALKPDEVRQLQSIVGNQAVARLLADKTQVRMPISIAASEIGSVARTISTNTNQNLVQREPTKRKRDDYEGYAPVQGEPPTKKRLVEDEDDVEPDETEAENDEMAIEMDDLTNRFAALSLSFHTGLDEEVHEIYPDPGMNDVIIASDPTPLKVILAKKQWLGKTFVKAELKILKAHSQSIDKALSAVRKSASKTNNAALRKTMSKAAKFFSAKGTVPFPITDLSNSVHHGSTSSNTVGKKLVASPLSPRSKHVGFTAQDSDLMTALRTKVVSEGGKSQDPVQAHLLNMKTFGPGELWNLTPASKQFNGDQERNLETPLKEAIYAKGLPMYFEAEVKYNYYPVGADYKANPQKYLFTKIVFKAHQLHEDITQNDYVEDSSVANDPDIQSLNQTMNWDQGNLPDLAPKPNMHTETDKSAFDNLGWPPSIISALTDYNKHVDVGDTIPGTSKKRGSWNGNLAKDKFLGELNNWLKNPKKTVTGKRVALTLPDNWKKQVDWS